MTLIVYFGFGFLTAVALINVIAIKKCVEFKKDITHLKEIEIARYKIEFLGSLESDICTSLDKIIIERDDVIATVREKYLK